MNGPPTEREFNELKDRVRQNEKDLISLREANARARGAATILGFIGGLFAAGIVSAVVRAIWN